MPKKITRENTCHPGGRSPLLDSGASQVSPCHRAFIARSQKEFSQDRGVCETLAPWGECRVRGGQSPLLDLDSPQDFLRHPERSEGSHKEIAHSVDSCETLPVPLRDDMAFRHPELDSGSINGGRSPHITTCHRGTRSVLLDSGASQVSPDHRARVARSQKEFSQDRGVCETLSLCGETTKWRGNGEGATLQLSETNALPNNEKNLSSYSLNVLSTFHKAAFTLAEVLITLSVIGIVAALTIPNLIQNHNEKAWSTAQSVFEKKLEVAARQMNTEEKLAGYSSTKDFVNELKKYIKITRVCDNDELTKCFAKEVIWNQGEDPIDMSAIKTAQNLGQEDWDTDTVGVQFANGVNAIIAYNPNATQDPYNNQFGATANSMAILYDVSGSKNPNTNGKDIGKINVESLGGVTGCMIDPSLVGDMCITQILAPGSGYSPMTKAECDQAVTEGKLGIEQCSDESDYWAGAVKACKGIDNMPNQAQLTALASYLYNKEVNSSGQTNGTLDKEKASQFLAASPYGNDSSNPRFYVWSGGEISSTGAYYRVFYSTTTAWDDDGRDGSYALAVCLGDN